MVAGISAVNPDATVDLESAFSGNLANNGETITLVAADMSIIKSFRYSDTDPWPEAADGDGPSLELLNPNDNPDHADPKKWRASAEPGGSPKPSGPVTLPGPGAGLLAEVVDL